MKVQPQQVLIQTVVPLVPGFGSSIGQSFTPLELGFSMTKKLVALDGASVKTRGIRSGHHDGMCSESSMMRGAKCRGWVQNVAADRFANAW